MNELCSTKEMSEKIINILSIRYKNRTITHANVARELNINIGTFSTHRKRNSPPYKEIIHFCYENDINPLEITMKKVS